MTLDIALGLLEVVLVPCSLAYLAWAIARRSTKHARRAVVLAVVLAITVAQPFGVKAIPMSPDEFRAGDPRPAKANSTHTAKVAGLPLFGFRPYRREIFYINGEGGYPSHWLKIRSWLWPGLLLSGDKVEKLCGTDLQPCWDPGRPDQARHLHLFKSGDEWRYRVLTYRGQIPAEPTPLDQPLEVNGYRGFFRLAVGITSIPGLAYWLVALALGTSAILRSREHADRNPAVNASG